MTNPMTDELLVAVRDTSAFVCVHGRGTFKVGPALKQFGAATIDQGCTRLVFDMSNCVGMDSTFMGVLAGLALRLEGQAGAGIVLVNLNAKTLANLRTLGLDRLIRVHEAGQATGETRDELAGLEDLCALDTSGVDKRENVETMLGAHQDLVTASAANLPKFKNVLDFLSQDLKKLDDDGQDQES
jgi:anti-anti-sigma regulatory factor